MSTNSRAEQFFARFTRSVGNALVLPIMLLFAFILGSALPALAEEKFCSDYPNGVIDGNVDPVPVQITIDRDCTFQNWPATNQLTSTLNFHTNDPSIYLIIFNNVIFTGHMACANVEHRIWFANGSDYGSSNSCQDLFIPVESIDKQSPGPVATVGEPFTYTLTFPSMTLVDGPSLNDLHSVTLWDDLAATGADLTFVSLNAYVKSTGDPVTLVTETDPLAPGGRWTPKNLSYEPYSGILPAGEQIIVEITVVPDNTPANAAGRTFVNIAKWSFGRLIEGEFYAPLPGEWGVSEPMTIAEPSLVVNKSSDETAINLGVPVTFTIDIQNVGGTEAWNTTIIDQIPSAMCDLDPTLAPGFGARIVEASGTTVADLVLSTDYSATFSGDPSCSLSLNMITDRAKIGPLQHLVVTYQSQLNADVVTDGLDLINVAGATQWFSADSGSGSGYRTFNRTLSDGTPNVVDHEDSQIVTTSLSGYYFQKTVENLSSGANPATKATAGDRLRYRIRLFNVDETINGVTISDLLDLNSFDPSTFTMSGLPAGTSYNFNSISGLLEISGDPAPLNVAVGDEHVFEFEITLSASLADGTLVSNQATLSATGISAFSDDPYVNGISPPSGDPPPDPTVVLIQTPGPLSKVNTQAVGTIGEQFKYTIKIPATPVDIPLYDVRITDNLLASNADMRFVSASVVSGGNWALRNIGTATIPVIADTITGIDIPANFQTEIEITVELENSSANQAGGLFNNSADYSYNRINGNETTRKNGGAGSTANMSMVEPFLTIAKAVRFVSPVGKPSTDPGLVGDVLEYTVTVINSGNSMAFDASIIDTLPGNVSLVAGAATVQINGTEVAGFVVNPYTRLDGSLVWGQENGDRTFDIPVGQSLVLNYQATIDSLTGGQINNSVYADWTSLDGISITERTGAGCPVITQPNDYCAGPATVAVSTIDNTAIVKSVTGDSFAEIPASPTDPVVRVGDTITYELTLSLHEFITQNVVVEDAMPEGLSLESFVILGGSNFSYTLAAEPASGDIGTLHWEFGDITNMPSNDGTPVDSLVIRYEARVVVDAPPVGVAYDTSILRQNQAQLSYTNGDPSVDPDRLTTTATVDVRQPLMSVLSKVVLGSGRTGSGSPADPYQVNLSTDVMNFQITSCNGGQAPAYGVVITDLLAAQFDESDLAANPPVVTVGTATLTAGGDYSYTAPPRGGEMQIALSDNATVDPGQCVSVNYNIGFHTDLTTSTTWSNQARLNEYWSLPTTQPGRQYVPADFAEVWMANLISEEQLLKTLASPAEATIGDEVVYQIRVPAVPMNRALDNVVVTDSLHATLEYVSASAVDGKGITVPLTDNSVAPGQVNLGITTIPAGGQVIITLTTRVVNNEQTNAGVSVSNTASYTYTGKPADVDTSSTSSTLTIIEPSIAISKTVANVSRPGIAPNAGDVLRYSVNFTASGGAAGDDFADAFDLGIVDSLGLGLIYQNGMATVNGTNNTITNPTVTGDGISNAQTLTWNLVDATADIDVSEGTTVTVTYDVLVADDVLAGQSLTNSVTTHWTGQKGVNALERTGTGTPAFNDYFTGPATTTQTVEIAVSFVKSVARLTPSGEVAGDNAEPSDTLRYTFVITNQSIAPLNNAVLTDQLAAQFVPGSLQIVRVVNENNVAVSVDTTQTDPGGGPNGTGIVDLRNFNLAAQGQPNDTLTVVFEAILAPVIDSGTVVLNRAQMTGDNLSISISNETATLISSAPAFDVWKTSNDLTGDPDTLLAGDILRYTITVKNIGNENAVNSVLSDSVPANTTYVPDSTTLNGTPVADVTTGVSPLQGGLTINAPEDTTARVMNADPTGTIPSSVATVTFDVEVNSDVVDGTIIANQGFVNANGSGSGPVSAEPSDDPNTAILDDPTRDVVGNLPLIDAHKTVELLNDSTGIVNPTDVLRYTIAITNTGAIPATGVVFTDAVPADTSYMADSVFLNGLPVSQPAGGVSPLISGIDISSSDLTPPLPGAGQGTLSPGATAIVTFDVRVNPGVATGTIISNQGVVSSIELPDEPTDADGIDTNGDQPTQVVVGDVQQLSILKDVFVVDGTTAEPGQLLEYLIRVTNIGSLPATNLVVTDDLGSLAGQMSYIVNSGSLNGSATGVVFDGSMLTASYSTHYDELLPGDDLVVRFRVQIDPAVAVGTTITNTGIVAWNDPVQTAEASVSLGVGGTPGSAVLNGNVWHDADLDSAEDDTEQDLVGWSVALYRNGQLLATVPTDAAGSYRLSGLSAEGSPYELRFRAAGAGPNIPSLGQAVSPFTNGPQQIRDIVVTAGSNLQGLNLPITPNGVVYDSVQHTPVAGSRLTLMNAGSRTPLPGQCFEDALQQNQVTAADGFYKFDLNFNDPSCPSGAAYFIDVLPPPSGYESGPSQIIAPGNDPTLPFSVVSCPGSADDALPATTDFCEITTSANPPPISMPPGTAGTRYFLNLALSNGLIPGQSQAFNNHLPVDPVLDGAVTITKTSSLINVTKGQLVPYTITVANQYGAPLYGISIIDTFPAGFKYVKGSARLNGHSQNPQANGQQLIWDGIDLVIDGQQTLKLLLVVGAGVSEGKYVNRAEVVNTEAQRAISGVAAATVRVVPDPTFDCTDVIGKVFDDRNLSGQQDPGEEGLPGVQVVTPRGLIGTTDQYGRFHITCAMVPDEDRGSNFILKLDDHTLPTGSRLTTENPRVQRATRGKMMKFIFGATIHRVVGLDFADGVFEPDKTELRVQWRPNLKVLIEELKKAPSVLRLSYLADVEPEGLVRDRLEVLRYEIARLWDLTDGGYPLSVETEVFWRRGGPR